MIGRHLLHTPAAALARLAPIAAHDRHRFVAAAPSASWMAGFALVLVRHPDGRFAVVNETRGRGLWVAGGRLEPSETFAQAARREAKEELGVPVRLIGILKFDHSVIGAGVRKIRCLYVGEPQDPAAELKTESDEHSDGAVWMTAEEVRSAHAAGRTRGDELVDSVNYVTSGGRIHPVSIFEEDD